jgi:uncharacterized protein with PIN domain
MLSRRDPLVANAPPPRVRASVHGRADIVMTMELEERTIEQLPDRCQNCGAKLTDAEKRAALTEGPPSGLVLCTTCAAEVVPVDEDEEAETAG